jgi:hypothetical protein
LFQKVEGLADLPDLDVRQKSAQSDAGHRRTRQPFEKCLESRFLQVPDVLLDPVWVKLGFFNNIHI